MPVYGNNRKNLPGLRRPLPTARNYTQYSGNKPWQQYANKYMAQNNGQGPTMADLQSRGLVPKSKPAVFNRGNQSALNPAIAEPTDQRYSQMSSQGQYDIVDALTGDQSAMERLVGEQRGRFTPPLSDPFAQPVTPTPQARQLDAQGNPVRRPYTEDDLMPSSGYRQAMSELAQARQGNFPALEEAMKAIRSSALKPQTPQQGGASYTYGFNTPNPRIMNEPTGVREVYNNTGPQSSLVEQALADAKPFGTTEQKMARGMQSYGAVPGNNLGSVGGDFRTRAFTQPDGGVTLVGGDTLGETAQRNQDSISEAVDRLREQNPAVRRANDPNNERIAFNRQRMENVLRSRRLGVENPLPAAPMQPGADPADVQAGLATQADNRGRLGRMFALRNRRDPGWTFGRPAVEMMQEQQQKQQQLAQQEQEQQLAQAQEQQKLGFIGSVLGSVPDLNTANLPSMVSTALNAYGQLTGNESQSPVETGTATAPPADVIANESNPVSARARLVAEGYSEEQADAAIAPILESMTPAQRKRAEMEIAQQKWIKNRQGPPPEGITQIQDNIGRNVWKDGWVGRLFGG